MTEPAGPRDLDWPSLLGLAARLGVQVWRCDKKRGLVQVASLDDPGTKPINRIKTKEINQ